MLLFLHNAPANIPVCFDHGKVYGCICLLPRILEYLPNIIKQSILSFNHFVTLILNIR